MEEQKGVEMPSEPKGGEDDDAPRPADIYLYLVALVGAMVLAAFS